MQNYFRKICGKSSEEITIDDEKVFGDVPDLELGIIRLLVPLYASFYGKMKLRRSLQMVKPM